MSLDRIDFYEIEFQFIKNRNNFRIHFFRNRKIELTSNIALSTIIVHHRRRYSNIIDGCQMDAINTYIKQNAENE